MKEFRTANMDLAAALWALRQEPFIETKDGIIVEFVWKDEPDVLNIRELVKEWEDGRLEVNARSLSSTTRRLRTKMRKVIEAFTKEKRSQRDALNKE